MKSIIEKNIETIKKQVRSAAERSGQREEDIKIIAVTKNVPIDRILMAIGAGIRDIGENKAQEITKKHNELKNEDDICWHFVGHLQRNKVRQIIDFVDCIQSVDSLRLLEEINTRALENNRVQGILLQVNMAKEAAKHGFMSDDVLGVLERIGDFGHVRVKGLMNIAPFFDDPQKARSVFAKMKALFDQLKEGGIPGVELHYLSMGMTNDFEVAIESGANMVRIGTGIFGAAK